MQNLPQSRIRAEEYDMGTEIDEASYDLGYQKGYVEGAVGTVPMFELDALKGDVSKLPFEEWQKQEVYNLVNKYMFRYTREGK